MTCPHGLGPMQNSIQLNFERYRGIPETTRREVEMNILKLKEHIDRFAKEGMDITCPHCGQEIHLKPTTKHVFCKSCGSDYEFLSIVIEELKRLK